MVWAAQCCMNARRKAVNILTAHLARRHQELIVLCATVADNAVDLNIVGRVGEHHPRLLRPHQSIVGGRFESVADKELMVSEQPEISVLDTGSSCVSAGTSSSRASSSSA